MTKQIAGHLDRCSTNKPLNQTLSAKTQTWYHDLNVPLQFKLQKMELRINVIA